MAEALTFYTNPMSRGRIARWMLEEVGEPYRAVVLGYGPPMQDPEYRRLNPMAKVPTLVHGETVVTECAAVCAYLADAFPAAGLAPEPARRGAYYRWLFFGAGPLEAAVTNQALGVEVPDEKRGFVGYGSLPRVLDTLETAVSGSDYLAGDRFTAADVYVGSQLGFGLRFGSIEARPAFTAYWQRLEGRPAAVRARELDDAAMPPKEGA
ncbi:glutathione S-transferase family protein [Amaricoccus sp.]|uniref:glutathione S-transferase family protein n=1 Tax=Amaricoccus sp. TaxID=1872485 RepID=UPI002601F3C6|nr:glutathione S-transferase family protein [Amaricoccus sp.]HRO12049.1 glutathione S-transferase family protein [Amaricoccus sp.]